MATEKELANTSSNRTIKELKHVDFSKTQFYIESSNRTIKELKRLQTTNELDKLILPIAP